MRGKIDNIRKIAVLRANGIGDFIFAMPALQALRETYREAEIVLLGLPWHMDFLAPRPSPVDRIIAVPFSRGIREQPGRGEDKAEIDRFFSLMEQEHFDIAIQMHGGGRHSNPFVLNMKPDLTVGLKTADAVPLDRWIPYIYFQPEILRYLEVVSLLGAKPTALESCLSVTEEDIEESLSVVGETDQTLVAITPGAGDGRRRWPPEKFAWVADRLAETGARVVVPGIEAERGLVESVAHHMRTGAENLCGRLSLGGLAGLLSRCALLVGNDSGPLHLAKAVGTPAVGIYWCGNLITAEPATRATHRPVLSWNLECPVCRINCIYSKCDHHESFVANIAVEEVYEQAIDLLNSGQKS